MKLLLCAGVIASTLSDDFLALAEAEASVARMYGAMAKDLLIILIAVLALVLAKAVMVICGEIRTK